MVSLRVVDVAVFNGLQNIINSTAIELTVQSENEASTYQNVNLFMY